MPHSALLPRLLLIAGFVMTASAHAETPLNPDLEADLQASFQELVEDGRRAGVVWAVARQDGEILAQGAAGQRDAGAGVAMTEDTIFRIYSMTRAVTAVAVMQQVEAGRIALDDPVTDWFPQLAGQQAIAGVEADGTVETAPLERPVTIRDLLTYVAGYAYAPQYPESVGVDHRDILALDQPTPAVADKLAAYPLRDQPGARWRYGYHSDLLAAVVVAVTGQPFNAYVAEHITGPLGMTDTGFHVPEADHSRLVRAYGAEGQDITDDLPPSSDYLRPGPFQSGGGGLVSTAADWLRFGRMLLNGGELDGARVLAADTVAAMRENAITPEQGPLFWYENADAGQPGFSGRFQGYGWGLSLGLRVADNPDVPGNIGEITWGGLANTTWFADPVTGIVALAFAQYLGPDGAALDETLRAAVYGAE